MDGWVVIGTELDTDQLEKDLKDAEKKLSAFRREEERLLREKGKVDAKLSNYEAERKAIENNTNELLKQAQTDEQAVNLLKMENLELEELKSKYTQQFTQLENINNKLKENSINQGLISDKIVETNNQLAKTKGYDVI